MNPFLYAIIVIRLTKDIHKDEYLIDCMILNAVFNSISVISRRPVNLSMFSWGSFNQYSAQYVFQADEYLKEWS